MDKHQNTDIGKGRTVYITHRLVFFFLKKRDEEKGELMWMNKAIKEALCTMRRLGMGCRVTELFIFTKIKRAKTHNNTDNRERKREKKVE